jgi:hypothetical protein
VIVCWLSIFATATGDGSTLGSLRFYAKGVVSPGAHQVAPLDETQSSDRVPSSRLVSVEERVPRSAIWVSEHPSRIDKPAGHSQRTLDPNFYPSPL